MKTTANYALQIPEATDTVNLLTQNYPNFETIDKAMKANKDAAITTATEVKTGTNHAIIRSNTDANMFRFVATSNMVAGDTFTVDSVVCTATTPDGQSLGNGAFVINQNVLCCLVGTLLTIYAGGSSSSEVELAKNAEKLGGELPEYYGTADAVTANTQAIDGLVNDVNDLSEKVSQISNNYTSDERVVGKWIDGTTNVYEVTCHLRQSTALTGEPVIYEVSNVDSVISIEGSIVRSDYTDIVPLLWNSVFVFYRQSGKFLMDRNGKSTIIGYDIILRYTKKST
jgi:hypothetical protein